MISVLILTKNEEQDLSACLESVRWSDDVHVCDSGSTDTTREKAAAAGEHFAQRSSASGRAANFTVFLGSSIVRTRARGLYDWLRFRRGAPLSDAL
jgi:glycosyltransferase involved in cell wall biosynthesis